MKKIFAILLSVLLLIGLVACGPPTPPAPSDTSMPSGSEKQTEPSETPTEAPYVPTDPNYGTIIYGSGTEISGDWGRALWTNNATDALIRNLIDTYSTVVTTKEGAVYVANPAVVEEITTEDVKGAPPEGEEPEEGVNYDTKIFKVKIQKDLTYNNGDPITAKDFIAQSLFGCTNELIELGAKSTAAMTVVGGKDYQEGKVKFVKGIRLYDDYTFSFEITADKLPYYYDITYAGATPMHYKRWFGEEVDIKDDGEGAYFNEAFTLDKIKPFVEKERYESENRVSAGPYTLQSFDKGALQATLVANEKFKGDQYGDKPEVKKIVIVKAEDKTWADAMKTDVFNVYDKITGGDEITTAMDIIEEKGMKYAEYDRAGYGKLMFQCDFSPTQFIEVRHAIAHLLDRPAFADAFTKGWGGLVHGPYGVAQWMYLESKEWIEDTLNKYPVSLDLAKEALDKAGFNLNEKGEPYESGLRYKKVTPEEAGEYKHNVKLADGTILMPLIIEWLSTENNQVSELLKVMLAEDANTKAAGMEIRRTEVTFTELLNYMYRDGSAGEQYKVKTYGMYNLATNFYPAYDMSYSWTMDPALVEQGYNSNYLFDEQLDKLSMDMVYGVPAGDDAKYLEVWRKYIQRWNELLPEVPLYSNTYITVHPDWLLDFELTPFWSFEDAIVGAKIKK